MAQTGNQELTDRFIQFYRNYYRDEVGRLAQEYPNERRSLYIDYNDLFTFDRDIAEDYLAKPEQMQEYAEEALRLYDLPADVSLGQAHVRLRGLPSDQTVDIRDLRVQDDHIGSLISVQGIVRKATDVRPKVTEAAFECQRCGTMSYIPQTDGGFQEPHECQGCERQGPFSVNHDQSEFVDSQKLRVQESPEGLRGGETPQSIDVDVEDDITGNVTAGDHVTVTGVLHIEQVTQGQEKTALFDLYMDGVTVEMEDEVFEDMDITDEDIADIVELSNDPDIYEKMVGSIAPAIYGYEQEKLAMVLQLFSGVTKHLPDGSRIRGDLHLLLIGDPGTGKCLDGDTRVTLADGRERAIREIVEENLDDPKAVDDGVWDEVDFEVPSMQPDGRIEPQRATKVWKREAPETLYRVRTASGRELDVTPSHPLFVSSGSGPNPVEASELEEGEVIATAQSGFSVRADGGVTVGNSAETTQPATQGTVGWDRVESIDAIEPEDDWVYDLEVEETHNYVSNGVVSHNSQMISYVEQVAPRSVYTSGKGSSAAGLCVTGDTLIHTAEGFTPIRDLATERHPDPVNEETAAAMDREIYTYDHAGGDIKAAESSHVWRMPEKSCRRIETAHGKGIETSTNTPLLVCGEDGIEWKEISDISTGDHVAVPEYTDIERTSPEPREFIEFTEEKLKPTEASSAMLVDRLSEEFGTLRNAAAVLDLPEDFVYDSLRNRHLPLDRLDKVLDAIDVDRSDIDIERAMLRHGEGVRIPDTFDADLMYLVGLVFGDGDVMVSRRGGNRGHVRISNSNEELLRQAVDIMDEKFDKRPEIEYQDGRVPCIRLHSATVARFFSNLGVESPKDDIALAPRLTTAKHADAFLRGLFDADGSVCGRNDGGSSVQFSTICSRLADQVQLMLETYGVRSRRRERDRRGTYEREDGHEIESTSVQTHLAIYGTELDAFGEHIGFRSTAKSEALSELVGSSPRRGEPLPVGDVLLRADGAGGAFYQNFNRGDNPNCERARKMLANRDLGDVAPIVEEVVSADLVWDEVTTAVDTGEKELFDLTVPGTHNFIGNGLVTHNTAAAVRDDFGDGQQWTLEAGALVLADKGIAAVDELDKMDCVTGDTLVTLSDGRVERIDELAREAAESGDIEQLSNGKLVRDVDLEVWTMDENGQLVDRPVSVVHEYDAPSELTRVEMGTGESLTATADHPFFVLEDGERVEREAAGLDEGDWVYVPREVPTKAADGAGVAARGAPTELEAVDDQSIEPAMASVLGYLSGDGNVYYDREEGSYGVRFVNTDEELVADFERAAREAFDATPTRPPSEQRGAVETVRVHGKEHADAVLDAGMNLGRYDEKCFPAAVSTGSRAAKAAFVRALADSEGHVDVASGNVRVASASRDLLRGTRNLLLQFGVSSQIQPRERDDGRDVYYLTVTDAESLSAFQRFVGFTATRKAEALDEVVESADDDRTVLDVVPEVDELLATARDSLRLHQSECGIRSATYCNFENGTANVSLHRARRVLDAFEQRRETAAKDCSRLDAEPDWETLTELKECYHVSQSELAAGTAFTQQQISRDWGESESVRQAVTERLQAVVDDVSETDLDDLRRFVRGDVKWRRVESVETVDPESTEHRRQVLKQRLADVIGGPIETVEQRARDLLDRDLGDMTTWDEVATTLDELGVSQNEIASTLDVDQSTISRWVSGTVETGRFDDVREAALTEMNEVRAELQSLLDRIDDGRKPKVYDLTVEGTHNFVANGLVVHNSSDRSAMHEGLEQQQISISKAGINATLKSRCSLLGAANPKYGRFDQYEPIGEQIDLEPALVSRFDLIFTVTDQPDPEHDSRLAEYILKTNYAGELHTQRQNNPTSEFTAEQVESVTDEVAPDIEAEMLRKYIAYAKRNVYPTMSDEARDAIEDFYVDLRAEGADEDAPVPVTARKLEALVRLAEASARVRLSDVVEKKDADKVIEIVRSSLENIGVDPETGEFDADVIETGTSKSQRDRIKSVKALIGDIEEEYDEGAPIEEVLDRAGEIGMDEDKAEKEIESLRKKGELYEPVQGHLRTT